MWVPEIPKENKQKVATNARECWKEIAIIIIPHQMKLRIYFFYVTYIYF